MGGANHFPWGKYLPLPSKQCPYLLPQHTSAAHHRISWVGSHLDIRVPTTEVPTFLAEKPLEPTMKKEVSTEHYCGWHMILGLRRC
jgi:hypothetical protein